MTTAFQKQRDGNALWGRASRIETDTHAAFSITAPQALCLVPKNSYCL
jgi:hypothetical protein